MAYLSLISKCAAQYTLKSKEGGLGGTYACACLINHPYPLSDQVEFFLYLRAATLDRYHVLLHQCIVERPVADFLLGPLKALIENTFPGCVMHTAAYDGPLVKPGSAAWAQLSFLETHFKLRRSGMAAFVDHWVTEMPVDEEMQLAWETGLLGLDHPLSPLKKAMQEYEEAEARLPGVRKNLLEELDTTGDQMNASEEDTVEREKDDEEELSEEMFPSVYKVGRREGVEQTEKPRGLGLDTDTKRKGKS